MRFAARDMFVTISAPSHSAFVSLPFSHLLIMGIPWYLFVLVALAVGALVAYVCSSRKAKAASSVLGKSPSQPAVVATETLSPASLYPSIASPGAVNYMYASQAGMPDRVVGWQPMSNPYGPNMSGAISYNY